MTKKTFFQGAVVLAAAGIIIKVLGAFFRIPLANMIGTQGMAYYQAAYPVYVFFMMLATAGIPVAISRMVSERIAVGNHYGAHKVFRVSLVLLLSIGVVSFSLCFFGAGVLVRLINMEGAYLAMRSIAPALLFVSMMAAFRGYFQGMQNMKPTATSQVVEQLFRVSVGLTLAYVFVKSGTMEAAGGAAFGATIGGIAGLITVGIIYLSKKNSLKEDILRTQGMETESGKKILGKIFIIAVPITIGAAIMPIMNFIDVAIIMRRLDVAGYLVAEAEDLYGQLSGFAGPLINFPQVLTQAVAMSLVPTVAMAWKQKDEEFLQSNIKLGLRTAMIAGFPCAVGLMVLAEPIMLLLYPFQRESALDAAPILLIMAFGVIFLSTVQTLTGVLQGIGKQLVPVGNLAMGAMVKIGVTWWLAGIYSVNVKGAAIGTVCAYMVAAILNIMAVRRHTGTHFDLKMTFLKPGFSSLVMGFAALGSYRMSYDFLGSNGFATLIAIGVGVLVYGALLFLTRAVTREEVEKMPKGTKILALIDKFQRGKIT